MSQVIYEKKCPFSCSVPKDLLLNKRNLSETEIQLLKSNFNTNEDSTWQNIFVDKDEFDAELIKNVEFAGFAILGKLSKAKLKYHDLELPVGIYNSYLKNVVTGDDNVIKNVIYLENYRLGNRVLLFNIQELSCTNHSKFGNGILKEGEPESNRITIAVGNENEGRCVLPFEQMIPADAYLWSRYRDDSELMNRFVELTEYGNTKKLDTYGTIGDDSVIKNTTLIKDAKIGESAYIKGAFKIKNVTILSSQEEMSQIGEGGEIVNGIMGYGRRVFYQAVAVRFVIGRNCQLKYGARLLNSVIGDNSTVSCCELLNNLIFPFHEQHHNSSFLIATTIMGQSNIAAGSTIGSNHNSRSPDGEIIAGRGFWPGLCSDFKHNSKFASFSLISKGSYQQELNICYPFSLVAPGKDSSNAINIIPAWWFMYDMFAIVRNRYKFKKRDKRAVKIQNIEMDPLAPDTMQEVLAAIARIIELTQAKLADFGKTFDSSEQVDVRQIAKDYLHQHSEEDFELFDRLCQKKYGAVIVKPTKAYKMYRKILKYYAAKKLVDYCIKNNETSLTNSLIDKILEIPLYTSWLNVGGQIIPEEKINELFEAVKSKKINTWDEVHNFYNECDKNYMDYEVRYAIFLLEKLYSSEIKQFNADIFNDIVNDVIVVSNDMYTSSVSSREKDFTDYFRAMTYRNKEEMTAVLGTITDNDFLNELKVDTEQFNSMLKNMFSQLCKN